MKDFFFESNDEILMQAYEIQAEYWRLFRSSHPILLPGRCSLVVIGIFWMDSAAESRFCMLQETISLNKHACFLDRNEKSCFFRKWHRAVMGL